MATGTLTIGDSIIDYGFDASGGFYALDHLSQNAGYAYTSSPHADAAKRCPSRVAARMLAPSRLIGIPAEIRLRHYQSVCRASGR
jgi:hypothetical protein